VRRVSRARFDARKRAVAALLPAALALAAAGSASAAVKARPHASFLATTTGSFSLTLDTRAANEILAGVAVPGEAVQHPISRILVVCPKATPTEYISELHVGFPGARLRLKRGRYSFTRSYTENAAKLVHFGTGAIETVAGVKVSVTGTVANAKLIKGTVSVQAPGCSLKSSRYSAEYFGRVP
jgi:hypothetical protein